MGVGLGFNKEKSTNSSSFDQRIMSQQIPALTGLWGSAADLYGGQTGQFQNFNNTANQLQPWMFQQAQAAQPAYQQQLQGGIQDQGMNNQLMSFLNSPSNAQSVYANVLGGANQTYADPLVNQLRQDMGVNMNRGAMRDLNTSFATAGKAGSDRNVLQRALTDAENNRNFGVLSSGIRQDSQAKDLAMQMQIAQQADSNKLAGLQLGFGNVNQQNQNQQSAFGLGGQMQNMGMGTFAPWMQAQGAAWSPMMNYANVVGSPQLLSSGQSKGKSSGFGMNFSEGAMGG